MSRSRTKTSLNPLAHGADWLASVDGLPLSLRAVCGYYADTGILDYRAMKVKSYVDDSIEEIIDSAYEPIEAKIATEFDANNVEFDYETKLTLPAELTLGYLYRQVLEEAPSNYNPITQKAKKEKFEFTRIIFDKKHQRRRNERFTESNQDLVKEVEEIERITTLVTEALIDGDMRDALNDEEYDDFSVNIPVDSEVDKRRIAEVAQETLQESIEKRLDEFPQAVRDAYELAVDISEGHQDEDESFRALLEDDPDTESIRSEYKFQEFDSPPELYNKEIRDLPYFKTQYDRVGVIYDGMIDMYRGAGFTINDDFKRSIVLAIIGAQIWLDDVSDYAEDREEGQLTPVTAEYLLTDNDAEAYDNVLDIAETYLDYAKEFAVKSGTPMTGIAVEYIYRRGEPSNLPR